MKRILKTGIGFTIVSMLFTGCGSGSLVSALGEGYQEIEWQVNPYDLENMPNYSNENEKNKYDNLEGEQAFVIQDGHSKDPNDIENFEIGTLLDDGTFIYKYITKEDYTKNGGTAENAKIVHCAAAYNYRTKQFKMFHEKKFNRANENNESFSMQLCDPDDGGNIFIYDNGIGYLYFSNGDLDYATDIETFARKHFKGYDVVVTNAVTDGEKRIFVELVIEKEEISTPEEDGNDISDEEAEEEAEKLDKEMDEKTIETVLVYELASFSSTIDQRKVNYDDQVKAWKNKVKDKKFTSEPNKDVDWHNIITKENPDQWGQAHLYFLDYDSTQKKILSVWGWADTALTGAPLLTWNTKDNEPRFGTEDGYVPDFDDYFSNDIKVFTDVKPFSDLQNVFIIKDGKYQEVMGYVSSEFREYSGEYVDRTYTYVGTRTNAEGEVEEYEEERTQTVYLCEYRDATLEGEYLESYSTLYDDDINGLVDVYDGMILCSKDADGGEIMVWRKSDGSLTPLMILPDEYMADVFKQDEKMYVCVSERGKIMIVTSISNADVNLVGMLLGVGVTTTTISGQQISEAIKPKDYEGTKVGSSYHEEYHAANEEDGISFSGSEGMDANKLVRVTVSPQKDLLSKLETYGVSAGSSSASGNGWLLTSFGNGLVYVDDGSQKSLNLDNGTWYGTWKQGDKLISVGFSESSSSYGTLDVAYARVKEYDINDLYKSRLETIINSYQNE